MLSAAYLNDVRAGKYPGVEAMTDPLPLTIDDAGTLTTPWL